MACGGELGGGRWPGGMEWRGDMACEDGLIKGPVGGGLGGWGDDGLGEVGFGMMAWGDGLIKWPGGG